MNNIALPPIEMLVYPVAGPLPVTYIHFDPDAKPASCKCGKYTYPTEAIADRAMPSGTEKCEVCRTFATDHTYSGGSEGRCWTCDTRPYSHR